MTKASKTQIEEALAKLGKQLHPPLKGKAIYFVYELRDNEYVWDVYKVGRRVRITYHGSMHDPHLKTQLKRACEVAVDMVSQRTHAVRIRGRQKYDL